MDHEKIKQILYYHTSRCDVLAADTYKNQRKPSPRAACEITASLLFTQSSLISLITSLTHKSLLYNFNLFERAHFKLIVTFLEGLTIILQEMV